MTEAAQARKELAACRRLVVKIGSQALADGGKPIFAQLAEQTRQVLQPAAPGARQKRSLILVSSGAIALGMAHLGMARRPRAMAGLQAAAAAGQGLLMQRYSAAFAKKGLKVAQVLLSHADLASRSRSNNARAAIDKLLTLGVVPIINENDAVAVDEIRFGDNDELAAMVTSLCGSQLLLLLSSVSGLLDAQGMRIRFAPKVDQAIRALASPAATPVGRGGMESKLEASHRATMSGAHVVIASASEPKVLTRVLAGEDLGTLFSSASPRLSTRKHWIAYTLRPRGVAVIDAGAAKAIVNNGSSVLNVGVLGIRGAFLAGDAIRLETSNGLELARGLTRLNALDAARLAGDAKGDSTMLVHRDDLVVTVDR